MYKLLLELSLGAGSRSRSQGVKIKGWRGRDQGTRLGGEFVEVGCLEGGDALGRDGDLEASWEETACAYLVGFGGVEGGVVGECKEVFHACIDAPC